MNHKIFKEATLSDLKDNILENLVWYESGNNIKFLKEIQMEPLETNTLLEVKNNENRSSEDLANAIKLYDHLKHLPLTLATDEKFWAYLTHITFWDYMYRRWPLSESESRDKEEFIKTRYFFSTKNKSFYRNGLSRLWWFAHLTYDSNLDDPYHYTRMLLIYQDLAGLIMESTKLSRNKVALKAVLEAIKEIGELEEREKIQKIKNKRQLLRSLAKHINYVGGVTIWDKLSQSEAYDLIWAYMQKNIEYKKSLNIKS